ncbi:MAG TPA: hypothetical protein VIM10_00525 [Actinopolymorphaceae bacterium]
MTAGRFGDSGRLHVVTAVDQHGEVVAELATGLMLDTAIAAAVPADSAIALRALSMLDHDRTSRETLIAEILRTGTDRHDPDPRPVLADFYDRWDVDLHAVSCMVGADGCLTSRHYPGPSVTAGLIRDFLEDPPIDGDGEPLRIDLISVYDLARLEPVRVVYDDGIEDEPTAFRFVDASAAATSVPAVLAIDYISGRRSRSPAPPLPRSPAVHGRPARSPVSSPRCAGKSGRQPL